MRPIHRQVVLLAAFVSAWVTPSDAADYVPGQIICRLATGATIGDVTGTWGAVTIDVFPSSGYYLMWVPDWEDMEALAADMEADPNVVMAEPNYVSSTPEAVRQMVVVAVGGGLAEFEDQSATIRIGLDVAHELSRGKGQTIAILDTGVDESHGAFRGKPIQGRDFIDDDFFPIETANGIDDDGDGDVDEGYGHGTMVAGIASLVAPNANLLIIRVLDDEGRGDIWTIATALRYAIDAGADVINLSFGAPQPMATLSWQVANARDAGISVVAAAGNNGAEIPPFFPAADPNALMITAVDSLDVKADFADWHALVSASAPGTGIRSAYPGGQWALGDGCSFATAFVTGEVALIRATDESLTPAEVEAQVGIGVSPIDDLPGNGPYMGKLGTGRLFIPDAIPGIVAVPSANAGATGMSTAPNPVFRSVRVSITPQPGEHVVARIYDVSGRHVRTLAGRGPVWRWDGRRETGSAAPAGVYVVRVVGDRGTNAVRRIQLVR